MNTIIIGIAGGTGSGKTSLTKGILSEYGEDGENKVAVDLIRTKINSILQ